MFKVAVDQKRRILYFALSLAFCTFLLDLVFGAGAFGTILGLLCATLFFAAIGLAWIVAFPKYRGFLELIAISCCAGSFIGTLVGQIPQSGIMFSAGLSAVAIALFNSPLILKLSRGARLETRAKRYVLATKSQIWAALIPGESHPDDYFNGNLRDFKRSDEDRDALFVTYGTDKTSTKEQALNFIVKSPAKYCRYYFEDDYVSGHFSDGVRDIKITEMENNACFVTITEVRDGLDPSTILRRWFDNYLARDLRRLAHKLAEQHGENDDQFLKDVVADIT